MNNSRTMTRQYSEYSDFFQHNANENTNEMQTSPRGSPLRSDGVDGTGDANQTLHTGPPDVVDRRRLGRSRLIRSED